MTHFYFYLMAGIGVFIILLQLYYEVYGEMGTPKLITGKIITMIINTFHKGQNTCEYICVHTTIQRVTSTPQCFYIQALLTIIFGDGN